ncbi:MAG: pyridoxal phosphate-dependent aminotransferase [Synergistaceae bacterium]|nr:pyridoxal phosphate-dependent aminotransferase [Synergistaceae bacterium]
MQNTPVPGVSKRGQAAPSSPIRRLEPFALEAKKKGVKVYPLHIGQPDVETPPPFFDAVEGFRRGESARKTLAYGPSAGNPELIAGIAAYYAAKGIPVKPSDVIITLGGSEAVSFAIMASCDPGDELLIPEPLFPGYTNLAAVLNVRVVPITTSVRNGYHLPSRDEIESKITPRTRAILLSHPGNPTGVVYTPEEVSLVAGLALRHGLFILADEVYREFVYDETARYVSFASLDGAADRVIIADSISKRFSACGARVGCIVSRNPDVMRTVLKFCQSRGCPPVLEQIGARTLYEMNADEYLKGVNREYAARRDTLFNILNSIEGVVCRKPEGAFYIMAKLPVDDAEKFVVWLLGTFSQDGETVMGAPGEGFYATPGAGKDEMRLAYVLKEEDLVRAGSLLKAGLAAYPGRLALPSPA